MTGKFRLVADSGVPDAEVHVVVEEFEVVGAHVEHHGRGDGEQCLRPVDR
jgi:hypothetical protein